MTPGDIIQLRLAVWFTGLCVIGCACFFAWLIWVLFWDAFDHIMQERKRSKNNRFKPRSERQAYRDVRGVQR